LRNCFTPFSLNEINFNYKFDNPIDARNQREKAYQELLNSGDIEFVNVLEKKWQYTKL